MNRRATDSAIDRLLRAGQIASSVLAIGAIILSLLHAGDEAASRRHAAYDSCQLVLGLVHTSTPASRKRAADAYVRRTPLRDCHLYARKLVP
jgi:hypothetical protein